MKKFTSPFIKSSALATLALAFAFTAFAQITPPTTAPSGAAVHPPINTSPTAQTKTGGLTVGSGSTYSFFSGTGNIYNTGVVGSLQGLFGCTSGGGWWCSQFGGIPGFNNMLPMFGAMTAGQKGIAVDTTGNLFVRDGTTPAAGSVLKAVDANGKVAWGPGLPNGGTTLLNPPETLIWNPLTQQWVVGQLGGGNTLPTGALYDTLYLDINNEWKSSSLLKNTKRYVVARPKPENSGGSPILDATLRADLRTDPSQGGTKVFDAILNSTGALAEIRTNGTGFRLGKSSMSGEALTGANTDALLQVGTIKITQNGNSNIYPPDPKYPQVGQVLTVAQAGGLAEWKDNKVSDQITIATKTPCNASNCGVSCPAQNPIVVGGGGACSGNGKSMQKSIPFDPNNQASTYGKYWYVECTAGANLTTVYAICSK